MQPIKADGAWSIAVHGGAGAITDESSIPLRLKEFNAAFYRGKEMLEQGAHAVEAVEAVVMMLEDSKYFNAGRGSVFTNAGTHEMDASIMDGTTGTAGAVCNVQNVRNPIQLARAVARGTQHVMLCGAGAESLAPNHGVQIEDNHYFFTEERYAQLIAARKSGRVVLDHGGEMTQHHQSIGVANPNIFPTLNKTREGQILSPNLSAQQGSTSSATSPRTGPMPDLSLGADNSGPKVPNWAAEHKFGTVGCVARDKYGNLAAAGSTGGLTNKQPGRIGDTPVIGAGVYANSQTCAVACTGQGETFIKHVVAHDVHARIKYQQLPLAAAIDQVILDELPPETGGMIGVSASGTVHAAYNTHGMFTGLADSKGRLESWHKKHEVIATALADLDVVPRLLDDFKPLGLLKVWYLQKTGAVSNVYISAVPGKTFTPAQVRDEPSIFFSGVGHHQKNDLHSLVLICPRSNGGEGTRLLWLVTDIPETTVANGQHSVPYEAPAAPSDCLFLVFFQNRPLAAEVGTIARDNLDLRAQIERLGLQPVMFTAMKCRPESEVKSRAARKQ